MRILFLDCLSGISGDMTVGALCDAGARPETIESALRRLNLGGELQVRFSRAKRCHIEGLKFDVITPHEHSHHNHEHHDHHGHAHGRHYADIRNLISTSPLSACVKERALAIFHRIAVAEGKIHGVPPDEIHFHEVGAIDSIADIVAACVAIEELAPDRIIVSPLREGHGMIHCAHGHFPIPAPATLEILRGIPLEQMNEEGEFITPTGAAIAAEFADSFALMPSMIIEKTGYGLGTREHPTRPNVLRAVLGSSVDSASPENVIHIEANIDDLSPELLAGAAEKIRTAGALDVWITPALFKKGRPGYVLGVLATPAEADRLIHTILRETSTFGVRFQEYSRRVLRRDFRTVSTPFGKVRIKCGWDGDELVQQAPEYEDCAALAQKSGTPVRLIYEAACKAASDVR